MSLFIILNNNMLLSELRCPTSGYSFGISSEAFSGMQYNIPRFGEN